MADPNDLVTRAQRTPHHRSGIRELGRVAAVPDRVVALDAALNRREERAALALSLSLAAESALPAASLRELLPDVEEPPVQVFLVSGAAGDRLGALGKLLDEELLTEDTEAYLLYVATERLGLVSPLDAPWMVRLRRIARRVPTLEHPPTLAYLQAALAHFTEPVLAQLSARPAAPAGEPFRVQDLLEAWDGGLDAVLGPEEAPRLVATVTVRSDAPKVGRNDACPCGSGKKYKKCHGQGQPEGEARSEIDAAALSSADLPYLRMADLAALDLTKMKKATLDAALGRTITFRRWALAERIAAVLDSEASQDGKLSVALGAVDNGRWDIVDRLIEGWRGELPIELRTHDELRKAAPALEEVSRMTASMLADPKTPLFELALGLLHRAPGLGIPFSRGLLVELPVEDGDVLIDEIERGRDVLALPPGDPAMTLVEALDEDDAARRRDQEKNVEAERERDALRASLARKEEELSARQAEVTSLAMRIEESEDEIARLASRPSDGPAPRASSAEGEKKKWSARIEELKALVQEGNRERAALRRQITELTEELEARASEGTSTRPEDPQETEGPTSPRPPVVPVFSRAAAGALPSLPLRIQRQAIELAGTLAAGEPSAWRNVKQMEGVARVWSARLGIHHRLLFRAHDDRLEVLDVLTREDLLKSLERWR